MELLVYNTQSSWTEFQDDLPPPSAQLHLCVITTDQAAPIAGFLFLCNIAINVATTHSHNRYSPSVLVKKFTCFKSVLAFLWKIECHYTSIIIKIGSKDYENRKCIFFRYIDQYYRSGFHSQSMINFELASFLQFFFKYRKNSYQKTSRKINNK